MILHRMMCVTFMLALAASVAAQTVRGTLQGTVTDTSGGVLPGVTMTITQVETGTQRTVITNVNVGRLTSAATGYAARTLQLVLGYRY